MTTSEPAANPTADPPADPPAGGAGSGGAETDVDGPRAGLPAPIWIGILTAAILALVAFIGRHSIVA